jgi:hypothetical protein
MHTLKDFTICHYCGLPTKIVWVHGHGQCQYCKVNVDECCRGEQVEEKESKEEELSKSKIETHEKR